MEWRRQVAAGADGASHSEAISILADVPTIRNSSNFSAKCLLMTMLLMMTIGSIHNKVFQLFSFTRKVS